MTFGGIHTEIHPKKANGNEHRVVAGQIDHTENLDPRTSWPTKRASSVFGHFGQVRLRSRSLTAEVSHPLDVAAER